MRTILEYSFILTGALLNAVAIDMFLIPNEIVAGGVTGLALVGDLALGVPFSVALVTLNLPLILLQWRYLGGPRIVIRTLVGVFALAAFTELLAPVLPVVTQDRLLTVAYGGFLGGLGLALVFQGRGTTGGADILARLCHSRFGWSLGRTMLGINVVVYGLAAVLFGPEPAMLALLVSYVLSNTLDAVMHGLSGSRAIWIVTEQPGDVREAIARIMGRGVTLVDAVGGHTGVAKTMLYAVVPRADVQRLKLRVLDADPEAFISILATSEAVGGFHLSRPQ